jgi:hypothetical protein
VNVSDANGCTGTASVCIGFFTGAEEAFAEAGLSIFPNPAGAELNIDFKDRVFSYSLYDAIGQLLISENATGFSRLNLSGFAKGVYLLQVESGGKKMTSKIIVE